MLYFSKIKIISILIFSICISYLAFSNFVKFDDKLIGNKINLGLDLQGGSYLLLEIDNKPVILRNLQNKLTSIRAYLKEEKISFKNIKLIDNEKIYLNAEGKNLEDIRNIFEDKNSNINPYYQNYKSHEYDIEIIENDVILTLSKYGLIELKSSSLSQALEIVRRRIDEIGTNEPNILRRGNDRILVELPGLDDPERIKSLLGKTANLNFRFITQSSETSFGSEKLEFEDGSEEAIVSKRIIISGENLSLIHI